MSAQQHPSACPGDVLELIERFDRNREAYKSGQYNEMQLRQEFLDPFFAALGWDMNNQQGYAEAYKDVILKFNTTCSSTILSCLSSLTECIIIHRAI